MLFDQKEPQFVKFYSSAAEVIWFSGQLIQALSYSRHLQVIESAIRWQITAFCQLNFVAQ